MANLHVVDFSGQVLRILHSPILRCVGMCSDPRELPVIPHAHNDSVEMIYFLEGEYELDIEGARFRAGAKDLVLLNPGVFHRERAVRAPVGTLYYSIGFRDLEACGLPEGSVLPEEISPVFSTGAYARFFQNCMNMMVDECVRKNVGYEQICQNLLQSVILLVLRIIDAEHGEILKNDPSSTVQQVQRYIAENYMRDISMTDVANQLHISYYHLSHAFKEKMGVSPHNYMIDLRISEATRLLINTQYPICEISNMVGYTNQSRFFAQFKKVKNTSPMQFRKEFQSVPPDDETWEDEPEPPDDPREGKPPDDDGEPPDGDPGDNA
jgi:AraC-like DNA-binding protein